MEVGFRTALAQSGETPAMLPNQPRTSVAVNTAIAVRGSTIHFQIEETVSTQLSRAIRGVLATIRVASQAGGSYTGNTFPAASTSEIPASNPVQAGQDFRWTSIAWLSFAPSECSRYSDANSSILPQFMTLPSSTISPIPRGRG